MRKWIKLMEQKGSEVSPSDYRYLYHLCDSHSYSYAIENNSLKTHGQGVSTTWDESMEHVVGRHHMDFKFVLDAPKLIDHYGAHHFDDHGYVGNEYTSHNEREIRIETREITPLSDYLLGTCLSFDLFSEKGIQWLLYRNPASKGFLQPARGPANQAIYHILGQMERGIPLWSWRVGNTLSGAQKEYLYKIRDIADMLLPFNKSLELVSDLTTVTDHWGKVVDKDTYKRRHMAPMIVKLLNSYYQNRRFVDVNVSEVKSLIKRIIDALKVGDNFSKLAMSIIEEYGLFSKKTAPVEWGSIIQAIMDMNEDELLADCEFYQKHHDKVGYTEYSHHTATQFGRGDW